jgi:ribosomal protein S26
MSKSLVHCPHCGSRVPMDREANSVHCMLCSRTLPVDDWITETYKRRGKTETLKIWGINHRVLYRIPAVQRIRFEKLISQVPRERLLDWINQVKSSTSNIS